MGRLWDSYGTLQISSGVAPTEHQVATLELPRMETVKLSEKGFEQSSDREFGRYTEAKKWTKSTVSAPRKATLQAHSRLFGQFLSEGG